MNRSRPKAFSLIELMVVIGLIAILGSLLLIGVGKLITNSKRQATQLAFQNCQAMYAEWDRVSRMHFPSQNDANRTNLAYSGIIPGAGLPSVGIPCPQNVATGSDRQGYAVLLTRDVMSLLRTMPVNAAALGKMSAKATMTFSSQALSQNPRPPNYMLDRVQYGTDSNTGAVLAGVCIQPTSGAFTGPPDMVSWLPAIVDPAPAQVTANWTVSTVPVLLDGWGNPIIFVPGGMLGYAQGSSSSPDLASNNGMLTAGGNTGVQVRSPDGRPFWASAGPDGDFSQGDDNMYSFEK